MADEPDGTGDGRSGHDPDHAAQVNDLERRRRALAEALSSRERKEVQTQEGARPSSMAGFGYAMRLSSEFIAAIIVGAAIGWVIDQVLGTTPWGLIVLLLLGFCAGILNVLRAAGLLAEFGQNKPKG